MREIGFMLHVRLHKGGGVLLQLKYHGPLGTASQLTPQRRNQYTNSSGGKGRVRTGDRLYPVPCLCHLKQDIPITWLQIYHDLFD